MPICDYYRWIYLYSTPHFGISSQNIASIFFCMLNYRYKEIGLLVRTVEYTDWFSAEKVRPQTPNKCPEYGTKQSDGEIPVILELWGMLNSPSLSLL